MLHMEPYEVEVFRRENTSLLRQLKEPAHNQKLNVKKWKHKQRACMFINCSGVKIRQIVRNPSRQQAITQHLQATARQQI